ncbi:MAG: glycyl-radical enzyme activating protein [Clostridia bacterium]|nr:glycyl-radical enzyme activating protein [Clostridia bacterium]
MTNERDVKGRIFDIQRYSIHDGPGIRTIVFFKGCGLRCRWCCNPESQRRDPEQMERGGRVETVGRDATVAEVMAEILRDLPYYKRSGGGVTLSGGECMLQPDFAAALLAACRAAGLHTAVETAGFAPRENIERVLPLVDLVLMDLKHTDPDKHRAWCGQPNDRIIDNVRYIAAHARETVVRVPVIPGFNDDEPTVRSIARFAASLPGVRELHLLPYHRLGYDKYIGLGRPYGMGDVPPLSQERARALLSVAEESGLACRIGG